MRASFGCFLVPTFLVSALARTVLRDLKVLTEQYRNELRWQLGNPGREDLTLTLWVDAIEEEKRQ